MTTEGHALGVRLSEGSRRPGSERRMRSSIRLGIIEEKPMRNSHYLLYAVGLATIGYVAAAPGLAAAT